MFSVDEGPVPEHTAKQTELGSDRWATSLDTGLPLCFLRPGLALSASLTNDPPTSDSQWGHFIEVLSPLALPRSPWSSTASGLPGPGDKGREKLPGEPADPGGQTGPCCSQPPRPAESGLPRDVHILIPKPENM